MRRGVGERGGATVPTERGDPVTKWMRTVLAAALAAGGAAGAGAVSRQVDIVYTSDVRGTVGICG